MRSRSLWIGFLVWLTLLPAALLADDAAPRKDADGEVLPRGPAEAFGYVLIGLAVVLMLVGLADAVRRR